MGKAAHVCVGRLLSFADLGYWPHKGVIQMGGSNEFVRPSTSSAGARLHEQRAGENEVSFSLFRHRGRDSGVGSAQFSGCCFFRDRTFSERSFSASLPRRAQSR